MIQFLLQHHSKIHSALPDSVYVPMRNLIWRQGVLRSATIVDRLGELTGIEKDDDPPRNVCLRYGTTDASKLAEDGVIKARHILGEVRDAGFDLPAEARVLDFGCGPGSVLRALQELAPNFSLFGCDLQRQPIRWLRRHHPMLHPKRTSPTPPLPAIHSDLDLIYAISVFTHMSLEHAQLWLEHFAERLRPGAALYLTFIPPDHAAFMKKFRIDPSDLRSGFYYSQTRNITIIDPDFLNERLARPARFEWVCCKTAPYSNGQRVAILRAPAS